MAGFGTLGKLDLDHFYNIIGGSLRKFIGIKITLLITAAEVACANLPDQISTTNQMVGANSSFTGVMRKSTVFCRFVKG